MNRFIRAIAKSKTIPEIWLIMHRAAKKFGATSFTYHFTPAFELQVSKDVKVYGSGFSPAWKILYSNSSFRADDPIPDTVMKIGRLVPWDFALSQIRPSQEVTNFLDIMTQHGIRIGYGVPLYGPHNRDAYGSFGVAENSEIDPESAHSLSVIADCAHQRICELLLPETRPAQLSAREREVLELIGAGKSNFTISQILGIAPDTVGTHVKRIYAKLNTSDRVSATVIGLKSGLISV